MLISQQWTGIHNPNYQVNGKYFSGWLYLERVFSFKNTEHKSFLWGTEQDISWRFLPSVPCRARLCLRWFLCCWYTKHLFGASGLCDVLISSKDWSGGVTMRSCGVTMRWWGSLGGCGGSPCGHDNNHVLSYLSLACGIAAFLWWRASSPQLHRIKHLSDLAWSGIGLASHAVRTSESSWD